MTDDSEGGRGARRRWLVRIGAGAAVVALAALAGELMAPDTTARTDARDRPRLHRWEMVGCWDLRAGSWRVQWQGGEGADAGAGRPGRPSGGNAGSAADLPASFTPPQAVMLLPDSVDRWGRVLPSRRAEPLGADEHPGRSLRWFVREDTLWIVWSEGDTRAGVALRREGDSLAGRLRTIRGGDSLDATAGASARRINCWTRERESAPRGR